MSNKKDIEEEDEDEVDENEIFEDDIQKYYFKQLADWIDNPERKSPTHVFTSGLGRFIAELCERYGDVEAQSRDKRALQ